MSDKENEKHETDIDLSDEGLDSEEVIELIPESPIEEHLEEECQKSKELFDRLQRLQAEFDNYRKRMDARFSDAAKFASEGILLKILDVYDNLIRALGIDFSKDPKGAKEGIQAIRQQMDKLLTIEGVRPIESVGKQFDPYYQHAVGTQNDPKRPDGIISEEYQVGYMLKEKVLRPAIVCVNRHESSNNDTVDEENKTAE
ncbi:MAG: nucleotide exchange factor GrpE [Candidatus Thorarchaeota archaeon]|nr:nucleotide exchange factor GrpE [Candidatus Thorarchaeota archaeon]